MKKNSETTTPMAVRLERRVSRCVFAFEWCSCIFESGFSVVSLHTTKRGAFRAMTEAANTKWYEHRDQILRSGKPRFLGLDSEAWRVRSIEVA